MMYSRSYKTIIQSKEVYTANLSRLALMHQILDSMGNPAPNTTIMIKNAIRRCEICIRRMDSLVTSLDLGDKRHIASQTKSLMAEITNFEDLSKEINEEIQGIKSAVYSKYKEPV